MESDGNIDAFLQSYNAAANKDHDHPTRIDDLQREQQSDLYQITSNLLCECTKVYTSFRRISEAKRDVFDYINNKRSTIADEYKLPFQPGKYESVGSRGEGLGHFANDSDLVCLNSEVFVYLPSIDFEPNKDTYVVDRVDCHPGYCRLKCHRKNKQDIEIYKSDIIKIGRDFYLKSTTISELLQEYPSNETVTLHGPAVTFGKISFDWVLGIQLLDSLPLYDAFLKRDREWPNSEVLTKLVKIPCSVVFARHPKSLFPDLEFRISFAAAEKFLIRNLSHVQIACYCFLRILKSNIDEQLKGRNLIRTYYVKTSFLWVCEKLHQDVWSDDNFLDCALLCLSYLQFCYATQKLPQIFIPENNLIDHLKPSECKEVLDLTKKFIDPVNLRNIMGCFCDDGFYRSFDQDVLRPRRNLKQRVRHLFTRTLKFDFEFEHLSVLMETFTLSHIAGLVSAINGREIFHVIFETIKNLHDIVTEDLIAVFEPMLYSYLGRMVHCCFPMTRFNCDIALKCFLLGSNVRYPLSKYDDKGLYRNTSLALFYYLNCDHRSALSMLMNNEHVICDTDPVRSLLILFTKDDLPRTKSDPFLSAIITSEAEKSTFLESIPVTCIAMAIYLTCKCELIMSKDGELLPQPWKIGKFKRSSKRNYKVLLSAVKDLNMVGPTLQVLKESQQVLTELMEIYTRKLANV